MSIEVEIKAWVDNFELIRNKLDNKYTFKKEYKKNDVYLRGIDSVTKEEQEIRLRTVDSEYIVTYKERSHKDKVEINLEKEFCVDDPENFLFIAEKLGYIPYIKKIKRGFCYIHGLINIELSHVDGLGDFIEIEYITENQSDVETATTKILNILENLDISRDKIEDRFYVEMLINK